MKKYEFILLDWDGNIAKTLDIWQRAFIKVLNDEGFFPDVKDISAAFAHATAYFESIGVKDSRALFIKADELVQKWLPEAELYPDALEVLEYLRDRNKKVVLITSSPRSRVSILLDKYNLHRFFDGVVTYDDVDNLKPHPEPLLKGLKLVKGKVGQSIMIGDAVSDIKAAANANMDSVLFYPLEHEKYYDFDSLKQSTPTFIIEDFKELMRIIE